MTSRPARWCPSSGTPCAGWPGIPNIVAVKDAKADLAGAAQIMAETGLAYYSGDDALNLPWLAVGAVGLVSVWGHLAAGQLRGHGDRLQPRRHRHRPQDQCHPGAVEHRSVPASVGVTMSKPVYVCGGFEVRRPRLPADARHRRTEDQLAADMRAAAVLGVRPQIERLGR